jgi:hypothetical protein
LALVEVACALKAWWLPSHVSISLPLFVPQSL